MENNIIPVEAIYQIHEVLGLEPPKHPLISLVNAADLFVPEELVNVKLLYSLFSISLKTHGDGILYGKNKYDFDEGAMVLGRPGQIYTPLETLEKGDMQGWILYFHPDLIRGFPLAKNIHNFSFFDYEVFEALHLSENEKNIINGVVENIVSEYQQGKDAHSQKLIVSNIELLLNYCQRFFQRQFDTRTPQSQEKAVQFEKQLNALFRSERVLQSEVPSVEYFASQANLSMHYFSDLIKKETGKTPKDHINDFIVEKAKDLLIGSHQSVSEIAYQLGFNYPHYFTRLFKARTGSSPTKYRSLN